MKNIRRNGITQCALTILNSSLIHIINLGELYQLLNIDIKKIIDGFNSGNYQVLDSEECSLFLNTNIRSNDIFKVIILLKEMLEYKKPFLESVEDKKNKMIYNPKEIICEDKYSRRNCTYEEFFKAIEIAEKILNDKRLYQLLNFYLKNENLISQIKERQKLHKVLETHPEKSAELLELLKKQDDNIGIIRIDNNGTISIGVGTRKDMEISNLIGLPFAQDIDQPGYDYGPHGDYWMPPKKVTKTFHEQGETELHKRMIHDERIKRRDLKDISKPGRSYLLTDNPYLSMYYSTPTTGYILRGEYALIITKQELMSHGIDPARVGWKPLRLKPEPKSLFDLKQDTYHKISLSTAIGIKKDELLLSLRK